MLYHLSGSPSLSRGVSLRGRAWGCSISRRLLTRGGIVPVVERLIDDTRDARLGVPQAPLRHSTGRRSSWSWRSRGAGAATPTWASCPHSHAALGARRRGRPVRARRRVRGARGWSRQFHPAHSFNGGAVGFFGYDLVRTVEPSGCPPNPDPLGLPDMALMVCEPDAGIRSPDARAGRSWSSRSKASTPPS